MGKEIFYLLRNPSFFEKLHIYGGEWARWGYNYPSAEWAKGFKPTSDIECDLHAWGWAKAEHRTNNLEIVLPSPRIGDFVWTWYSNCLLTTKVKDMFQQEGFTGYTLRPVHVEKIKRVKKGEQPPELKLWELVVTGKGGDTDPESGIRLLEVCKECGDRTYSPFTNGILVDTKSWDHSDFFLVNGYPKFILITEKVKGFITKHRLTNCMLIPSHKLQHHHLPEKRPEDS